MSQNRRKRKRRGKDRIQIILCVVIALVAVALSLSLSYLFFGERVQSGQQSAQTTSLPAYDINQPFSVSDLTARQLEQIRQQGRIRVSDGPRGISVGDALERILERFPTDYTGDQPGDAEILYCAEYFANANGIMTALPPRGMLTVDNGSSTLVVTFLTPTTAYPAGTQDNYRSYEHVYCVFTVEPVNMTISTIELGLTK